MNHKALIYTLALASFPLGVRAASAESASEAETAEKACGAGLLPGRNDVSIRTLRFRDVPAGHTQDPFQAIRQFFANRLEWVYLDFTEAEREKTKKVEEIGILFGGAGGGQLMCWVGDTSKPDWEKSLAMLDLNGKPVIMPHKRNWKNPHLIGDVSNPDYLRGHIEYYKRYLDYGASTLQRDEVESTVFAAERYGGGFTKTGLAGFSRWLGENLDQTKLKELGIEDVATFDYAQYLREAGAPVGDTFTHWNDPIKPYWIQYWSDTTRDFFRQLIAEVRKAAGRPVAFSCNNTSLQIWEPAHLEFDFAISEMLLGSANPVHMWNRAQVARDLGKFQVFGAPKTRGDGVDPAKKAELTRKVIATAYATGSAAAVPWDLFLQTVDGSGRYFGEPKDYSPIYGFIRAHDWSGYNEIQAQGDGIVGGTKEDGLIEVEGGAGIYAFLQNGGKALPPLIHLVAWGTPTVPVPPQREMQFLTEARTGTKLYFSQNGEENLHRSAPEPFMLRIHKSWFGDTDKPRLELRQPAEFTEERQKSVVESGDFGLYVDKQILEPVEKSGDHWKFPIPALKPWAVIQAVGNPD